MQALVGGTTLTDVTLQGSVTYTAGSDQETGPFTLVARSNTESLLALNLSGGQRREIRSGIAGVWVGADGAPHAMATHNCFLSADWFYPAFTLSALASDPTLAVTLVGMESRAGEPVYHLILLRNLPQPSPDSTALIQRASAMNLYLDATTLMPSAVTFNIHPDKDANVDIPAEIRFGSFQAFQGITAPARIQKYLQNSLVLDLTVTNVAVNSGVSESIFTLPAVSAGGAQ